MISIDWFAFFLGFYAACSCGWIIFWVNVSEDISFKERVLIGAIWVVAWPLILTVAICLNVTEAIRQKMKQRNGRA